MNATIKIGTHLGQRIYLSEEKLNEVFKMFPRSYLRCLEGICEIIRHRRSVETNDRSELVFESVFGKVGVKYDTPSAKWFVDWWCFSQLENM